MVAVSVDYRIEYLHHSTPFDSFEDAKDAICWLRSHASDYQLDPDKIAVAGGSAGGHLAAALGTIGSDEAVNYRPNLYGFERLWFSGNQKRFRKNFTDPSCIGSNSLHSDIARNERSDRIGRNDQILSG